MAVNRPRRGPHAESEPAHEPGWWLALKGKSYRSENPDATSASTGQRWPPGENAPAGAEFDEWYRATHTRLVASVLLVGGDLELARDAADEAFARACAGWDRVRRMDSPIAWTCRVALHVLRRAHRRTALHRHVLARRPPLVQLPASAAEAWDLVSVLPIRERTAVVLRYVAELSERDVAEAMGMAPSAVSRMLADAHRRLADLITPEPIDMDSRDA